MFVVSSSSLLFLVIFYLRSLVIVNIGHWALRRSEEKDKRNRKKRVNYVSMIYDRNKAHQTQHSFAVTTIFSGGLCVSTMNVDLR